ncbi:MAG: DJ-1 family glyoxalase III [Brevinema sp.]
MESNILVLLQNQVEDIEFITPVDLWRRAGYNVTTASITDTLEIISQQNIKMHADVCLKDISSSDFDYIFIPGGAGHKLLLESSLVTKTIQDFVTQQKPIIAICAAPILLVPWLENKKATCYPAMSQYISNFVDQDIVVDLPFITSQGVGTATNLAFYIISLISGAEFTTELKKTTVFL